MTTQPGGPLRLLFVGSEEDAAKTSGQLRRGGYDVRSGRVDALDDLASTIQSDRWDIVICQGTAGGVDGPSALLQIKRLRPHLPVIIISPLFGESVAAAAMKAGADDFVTDGFLARLPAAVDREMRAARLRRQLEEASRELREIEKRSNAFLDNSPAIASMKDEEGRLVYVNAEWERVFGLSLDQVRGRTDVERLPAAIAAQVRDNDRAVLAGGRTLRFEESLPTAEGIRHWLVFKFPFQDASGGRFVGGVAVDITERRRAEEALRVSEDLHKDLVEQSGLLICVHDLEGRILAANEAARSNLGYEKTNGLDRENRLVRDILAPESRAGFDRYIATILQNGVASGVTTVLTATGQRRHWEYRNTLRTHGVQQPVVRGIALDITDRVRAEEELREARQFSEQIIASAGEGIIVYDRDLRYVLWNQFMEELTGMRREEVIGRSPREIFAHVDEQRIDKLLERALAGEKVVSPDYRYRMQGSGRSGWVSATFAPHRNARGDIVGVIGIIEDITERKRSEETLRENQAFLEKAQEVGQIGSWVSGLGSGASLVWSKETCRIFGVSPEAFDGMAETFFSLVHPEDLQSVQDAVGAAIAGGTSYAIDHRIVRPDGSIRWVHERADIVRNERGEPVRMVGIVQDITERTRLEQQFLQSQKMEAIGRLAGGVAHDFNNLLTAILGYADLLLSQIPEGRSMRGDVEEIQKAGERAASLTRQLLAFSRRQMLELRVLDVNAIVTDLESMLRRLIGEDVELVTRLEPRLARVRADPGQLEQVIVNLAVNSRDAMPAGGELTIETRNERLSKPLDIGQAAIPPGSYSIVSVRDNGTGMDAATQARLFEPFFTTKEQGKGTGLGLATAYGIVKQSGGFIICESTPGKGTVFQIYLPTYSGAVTADAAPLSPPLRRPTTADRTVLLVEDEDGVRRLSRRLLEAGGFEVLEAAGGQQALAIAEAHPGPIHLLLTDVVMPGWRGPEVAARIGEIRPGIQILYISGYADVELGPEALLLRKPFPPEMLAAKVQEVLQIGMGTGSEMLRSTRTPKR